MRPSLIREILEELDEGDRCMVCDGRGTNYKGEDCEHCDGVGFHRTEDAKELIYVLQKLILGEEK